MRISDADRSRAVDELRRHLDAGRIDIDSFAERVAAAMEAETLADLDHALRDLPRMRVADPSPDPPFLAPGGRDRARPGAHAGAWRARLVVLLTVLVVAVGACFLILAHWIWAVVLVVGWLVGIVQGRVRVRRP